MNIIFIEDIFNKITFNTLLKEVPFVNYNAPRDECFMSTTPLRYGYDTKDGVRYYESIPMTYTVQKIMNKLNEYYDSNYNVCFLNYYKDEHQHLGWHSDDSPEMDMDHPISVVSFGEPRFIYVKERYYKGEVPDENKYLLTNGSLFIMPAGYQKDHLHKIPRGGHSMGGRISLTFRKYKN